MDCLYFKSRRAVTFTKYLLTLHLFGYRCIGKPSRAHSRLPPAGHVGPRLGQQVGREQESSKMYLTKPPCGNLVVRPWRPLLLSTRCTSWLRPPGRWKPPTAHLAVRCTQRQLGVLLVLVVVVGASGGQDPVDDGHAHQQLLSLRQSLESSDVLSFPGAASSRMNVRSPFLLWNIFPFPILCL